MMLIALMMLTMLIALMKLTACVRKETKETKETKEKRGINKPSWRGIATDDLADTDCNTCNSVAIYLCITTLLIHNVIPSATRDLLPDGTLKR